MSEIRIAGLAQGLLDLLNVVQSGGFVKFERVGLTDDGKTDGDGRENWEGRLSGDESEIGERREIKVTEEMGFEFGDAKDEENEHIGLQSEDAEMRNAEQDYAATTDAGEHQESNDDADYEVHEAETIDGEGDYQISPLAVSEAHEADDDAKITHDDGNHDSGAHSDAEVRVSTTALYYVTRIEEDGVCTDFKLTQLRFGITGLTDQHRYQVYGDQIHFPHAQHCSHTKCEHTISISELAADGSLDDYTLAVNPSGDSMRRNVPGHRNCPANCDEGFLAQLSDISLYVPTSTFFTLATREHRPICPVCVGLDVLQHQQALKADVENMANFDTLFDRQFQLTTMFNARRHVTHYEFLQFDERELGMLFEDLENEDGGSDDDDGGNAGWQIWAEAMDPNASLGTRPASEETIAALPRKLLRELRDEIPGDGMDGERVKCHVCIGELEEGEEVVQLPCRHVFHGDECIGMWLRQQKTCPVCRQEIA